MRSGRSEISTHVTASASREFVLARGETRDGEMALGSLIAPYGSSSPSSFRAVTMTFLTPEPVTKSITVPETAASGFAAPGVFTEGCAGMV